MSLADRLAKAQQKDRISDVRGRVQEQLVESLGPRLYDATMSDTELEGLVHQRLRELLDEEEGPLSAQEKLLIVRQIGDSVLGLGPLEPFVRDPEVTEIMVNNWDTIYVERAGKLYWTGTKFHDDQQLRRTIDKIVGKVGRRVDEASPLRRRAPARRLACERRDPAARDRRAGAHDPEVRRRPVPGRRPDRVRHDDLAGRAVPRGVRPRPDQHPRRRRHGRREDHHPERGVVVHPGRRADPDDRGRRGAQAAAAPCGAAGVPPAEHRGQGRRSRSATSSGTRCACGPTASSSARSVAPRRSTCSRR